MSAAERRQKILDEIASAARLARRKPNEIRLIAVSKTRTAEDIGALVEAGQQDFAESRVQEALAKWPDLLVCHPKLRLHCIGRLQSNKAAEAVKLFIQAGMSPNQKNDQNRAALNHAVLFCAQSPAESAAVIQALIAGKADVKTKDPDNGTTALVGSVQSCSLAAVDALIKAGSDLTAKSNGGATALQLAQIFQRQDIAAALQKAGAK